MTPVGDATENGCGRIIDSQSEVGGFPSYPSTHATFDPEPDPHGDADQDGYANLEERLHPLAAAGEQRTAA